MNLIKKISIRVFVLLVFLLAANQVYRLLFLESDLQEHSDLINLVRELPDSARIVYLGESSNFTFGDFDINTSRISDLISGYYPDIEFGTISHGALHAGNFKILLNQIPEDSKIETLIVTLNLRSFNSQWIDSKLETSLAKSMVLLKQPPPLFKRSILSFKAYDIKTDDERQKRINKSWEKDEIFLFEKGIETTVDQWAEEILAVPDTILNYEQRILGMHYIRTYAFEIDTAKNVRIKDFDDIVRKAQKRDWNLVFNLMAENTEKANQLVGPELVRIMRNNALLLGSRYTKMGVTVVNNLESVSDASYLDRNWTTEHYDEAGRKIVAKNVARKMKSIYPSYYKEVVYKDNVQKAHFFNDCEGTVRWFQMGTCTREKSYSGDYSSKINREDPFSVGLTRQINMVPSKNLNEVNITFRYFQPFENSSAQIVMEMLGGEKKPVWLNYHVKDSSPVKNDWDKIDFTFNMPEDARDYQLIKLYIWNPGKEPVYIDDIDIHFN